MRVLLSAYGARGDVEPVVGLAVRLWALGAQVRVCAPPGCAAAEGEVELAEEPEWGLRRDALGIRSLSGMGDGVR